MSKYVIGVDVGGTNVKLGIVNPSGQVIARSNLKTKHFLDKKRKLTEAIFENISGLISENELRKKDILGIGIGLPGLIDTAKGIVCVLPNIPGWKNVPLKKVAEKRFGIPTYIDNDVNLIALAEWKYGAGRGASNMVCITLGTGVGGGLILNNRMYRGPGFVAGEIGHMPINEDGPACSCGGFGCLESYVGNRQLVLKAQKMTKRKSVTLEEMFSLASKGDKKALLFWKETAIHIGNGLVGMINLINPERIVIGGGVANNFKFLHKTIESVIQKRAMSIQRSMVKVMRAQLDNDAGILGAQVLVKNAK